MSSKFNPYQTWFGLSTTAKPTYYELLGLRNFETEPPVIAEAAECRIQLLEPHKGGPQKDAADRLTREVTAVMNVLLSPDKRRQYDEKLRGQLGLSAAAASAPAATLEEMLPPALDAAESPTAMLPPGAFSLPPLSPSSLSQEPPPAFPGYASQVPGMYPAQTYPAQTFPGQMPTAPPYMPAGGINPTPAAFPGAAPYAPPGATPAYPSGFNDPAFAAPMATAQQGYSAPGYSTPGYAAPAYAASAMPAPAAYAEPTMGAPTSTFGSAAPAARGRRSGVRRSKNSTMMIAFTVLGSAVAILVVVMLAASANNKKASQSQAIAQAPPPVIRPGKSSEQDALERAARGQGLSGGQRPTTPPGFTSGAYRSASQQELMAESVNASNNPVNSATLPSMPDLVKSMAPAGAQPSFVTPGDTTPKPAVPGTPPPPTTSPPATPPASMTAAKPAMPVIAGTAPSELKMEAALPADAKRVAAVNSMLGAARKLIRSREYDKAEEIILQAQVTADAPELITSTLEHERLMEYARAFWNGVRQGVTSLKEGDELTYDGKTAIVVKHDELTLVVKQDNKDVVLQIDKLTPGAAVLLAERSLPKDEPSTKLAVAAFLGLDQVGDRPRALTLLDEAGTAGGDVAGLKAVLESEK